MTQNNLEIFGFLMNFVIFISKNLKDQTSKLSEEIHNVSCYLLNFFQMLCYSGISAGGSKSW
jgi:hypothetical protein